MVRILMVDDHTLFRKGLKHILPELGGFEVAEEASASSEALNQVSAYQADVVLLDIKMLKSTYGKRFWMMAQLRCSLT